MGTDERIPNEPENVMKRREKQVMDNIQTEKELLLLRSESQEAKFKEVDSKMTNRKAANGAKPQFINKNGAWGLYQKWRNLKKTMG